LFPRIDSIKQLRLKIGITQKKLASMTGVSTSMINQIESGRSQPSYETAKRIFDSLALKPSNTLHDAIKKMRKFSISQVPVFVGSDPVGIVTEDNIVRHISDVGESELKNAKLEDVMEPAPPVVDFDTPANTLVPLIRFSKCILVSKKSKIYGIITATDTLKMME